MRALPLEPRLAAMVVGAAPAGAAERASQLAMLLSERGLGGPDPDLALRLERFLADPGPRARDARRLAAGWARMAGGRAAQRTRLPRAPWSRSLSPTASPRRGETATSPWSTAARRHCRRNTRWRAKLSSPWPKSRVGPARSRILAAAALTLEEIERVAGPRIETRDETAFDPASAALRRRRFRRLGAIRLAEQNMPVEPTLENAQRLAQGAASAGVERLPWSKAQAQLRDRVAFLRAAGGDEFPDLSDVALGETASEWLAPFIIGRAAFADIATADLDAALAALLPYELSRRLEAEAPAYFETPAGSNIALDYAAPNGPLLSARVQEFYGLAKHPTLAGGRAPVTLELLSPAHRPIQTTRDLPGFWAGSWAEVKKEMKGRYPRHPWPDDPANALPTTRAKRRSS